jgi:hypothetical protein
LARPAAYLSNDANALAKLKASAKGGDANAEYWLGVMYDMS